MGKMIMSGPDIFSPEYEKDPYPFYQEMQERYPLYFHEQAQAYVLSRFDDVSLALKSGSFSTANYAPLIDAVHGPTIMQMEGTEHSRHRSLVAPAFRGADLRDKFTQVIDRNARAMIEAFRYQGEVDFVRQFARFFPINVIVDMLGLPKRDVPLFHRWYTAQVRFIFDFGRDPEAAERVRCTKEELYAYLTPYIAERREKPGDDLLSTLCAAEIDGVRLDDTHLKAFVSLLLTAGGETTDKALGLLFRNLIDHPEQMQMVREDRGLIDRALAETMRYSAPSHMLMRTAVEDVTMSGGTIPKGAIAICLIGAANRDPRRFRNPDRFDILRQDLDEKRAFTGAANHMGFGAGRHFCVGALLARLEVNIATNVALDVMEDIRYRDGAPEASGIGTRGFASMPLLFTPVAEPVAHFRAAR
jgi:pulcherriminic acid synthase